MALPKITSAQQRKIEIIIKTWRGKLTWDALVKKLALELRLETTRQTLCTYTAINAAFQEQKAALRNDKLKTPISLSPADFKSLKRLEALKAENEILKRQNSEQLRMIERILANARAIPNVDLRDLVRTRPEEI